MLIAASCGTRQVVETSNSVTSRLPDPAEVIDVIAAIDGAIVVKGNHDEAVEVEPKTRELNDVAYDAIVWTRGALSSNGSRPILTFGGVRNQ